MPVAAVQPARAGLRAMARPGKPSRPQGGQTGADLVALGQNGRAYNVVCVVQDGRLSYEALLFAASFRASNPDFQGRLLMAEPQPGPLWQGEVRVRPQIRALLETFGVEIVAFENRAFGQSYPYGNKIEALLNLPQDAPFVFFDTDTLFTGSLADVAFDFDRPSASMKREGSWPQPGLYGPGYEEIWRALYDRFGLAFEPTWDMSWPVDHWQRYLYFNAGWFFHSDPHAFGQRFLDYALSIRDGEIEALASQSLDPWLDQVALPLVIQSFGGDRPGKGLAGLDGDITCHYRTLPLLYARESDRVVEVLEEVTAPNRLKKVLKEHEALKRLVYQGQGQKIRALFDRAALPRREQAIRQRIKAAGLWLR